MTTKRFATPAQLIHQAGALPAALLGALMLTAPASAQNEAAPPDKPAAGADGDKAKVKVSEHMTVDLHVKDEAIANVLELLSIQSQKNIIASKNVTGKVSADLYSVTFFEALDALLHVNGYVWMEKGNFIYVYTREEYDQIKKATSKRVAKVVRLNYLNGADAAEFVKPLLSEGAEIKTTKPTESFTIPENTPTGKDDFALGSTLVVIDYPENIEAIEKLLVELDTKPVQVLVAATVLQTQLTEDNAFGVDLSFIGDLTFSNLAGLGGARNAASSLVEGGGGAPPRGISTNKGQAVSSTPGRTSGRSTLKVGIVSNSVAAFIRLLDEVTDTTVLSNPRLLTLNRQPGRVLVGERVAYLSTTQTETSQTQTVEFLDTGVQLYFRPFVSNTNEIRMELKPQVSSATPVDINAAGGGTVTVPNESTQELVTNVIVKDGMTVVLGGLFTESTTRARSQVPVIGDIPIIGAAFRGHEDTIDRSEIIFLVTPTIVNDKILLEGGMEGNRTIERVRAGTRQGLLPFSQERMTAALNVEAERLARDGQADKALWTLQRSLSMRPLQPDAIALRERITSDKEVWPNRSLLSDVLDAEVKDRLDKVQSAPEGVKDRTPFGHHPLPRVPLSTPSLRSSAEPNPMFIDQPPSPSPSAAPAQPARPAFVTSTPRKDSMPKVTITTSQGSKPVAPAQPASSFAAVNPNSVVIPKNPNPDFKPFDAGNPVMAFAAVPGSNNAGPALVVGGAAPQGFAQVPTRRSRTEVSVTTKANNAPAQANANAQAKKPEVTAAQQAKRQQFFAIIVDAIEKARVKRAAAAKAKSGDAQAAVEPAMDENK